MQLSVRDVAKIFRVAEDQVYEWMDHEALPVQALNGQHRFNRAELLEWATARNLTVPPDLFDSVERDAGRLPTLTQALERGGVFHNVPARDKPSAFAAIVERMPLPPSADRKFLLNILLAREALTSTGIGDGIAIPHPRNPIALNACPPQISLCFLEKPIDFNAIDARPVYALFAMVCPAPRVHLHLLSRLSYALHRESFRKAVAGRAPAETILAESRRVEPAAPAKGKELSR